MAPNDFRNLISLNELARILPEKVHISSVYRWMNRGIRGKRLKTVLVGGRRYVSLAAIAEFFGSSDHVSTQVAPKHSATPSEASAAKFLDQEQV